MSDDLGGQLTPCRVCRRGGTQASIQGMTTAPLRTSVRTKPTSAPRTRTDWERVQA